MVKMTTRRKMDNYCVVVAAAATNLGNAQWVNVINTTIKLSFFSCFISARWTAADNGIFLAQQTKKNAFLKCCKKVDSSAETMKYMVNILFSIPK